VLTHARNAKLAFLKIPLDFLMKRQKDNVNVALLAATLAPMVTSAVIAEAAGLMWTAATPALSARLAVPFAVITKASSAPLARVAAS